MFHQFIYVFIIYNFSVISELIHYTVSGNSGGIATQLPLIHVLVPRVMSLKEQLKDPSKV